MRAWLAAEQRGVGCHRATRPRWKRRGGHCFRDQFATISRYEFAVSINLLTSQQPWNWSWELALDCEGNATSLSTQTGSQASLIWTWDWAWDWSCAGTDSSATSSGSSLDSSSTSDATNTNVSVRVLSPGDNDAVTQSNTSVGSQGSGGKRAGALERAVDLELDVHVLWSDHVVLDSDGESDSAQLDVGLGVELDVRRRGWCTSRSGQRHAVGNRCDAGTTTVGRDTSDAGSTGLRAGYRTDGGNAAATAVARHCLFRRPSTWVSRSSLTPASRCQRSRTSRSPHLPSLASKCRWSSFPSPPRRSLRESSDSRSSAQSADPPR